MLLFKCRSNGTRTVQVVRQPYTETYYSEGYIRFKDCVHKFSVSHVAYLNKDVDTDTLKDKCCTWMPASKR